jgi:hypothetical protein
MRPRRQGEGSRERAAQSVRGVRDGRQEGQKGRGTNDYGSLARDFDICGDVVPARVSLSPDLGID